MIWKSFPQQVLFSLISTVYKRILRILRKRKCTTKRTLKAAFKACVVYTITRSDILDRFLGMCRKGTPVKVVEGYTCKCVYELDENKRFVYSQAFYNANWLKSLVHRPRDKSRIVVDCGSHLRNLGLRGWITNYDDVKASRSFEDCCNLWEIWEPSDDDSSVSHCLGSSGLLEDLSDPDRYNEVVERWEDSDYEY
jgi:hypothetical protein